MYQIAGVFLPQSNANNLPRLDQRLLPDINYGHENHTESDFGIFTFNLRVHFVMASLCCRPGEREQRERGVTKARVGRTQARERMGGEGGREETGEREKTGDGRGDSNDVVETSWVEREEEGRGAEGRGNGQWNGYYQDKKCGGRGHSGEGWRGKGRDEDLT